MHLKLILLSGRSAIIHDKNCSVNKKQENEKKENKTKKKVALKGKGVIYRRIACYAPDTTLDQWDKIGNRTA